MMQEVRVEGEGDDANPENEMWEEAEEGHGGEAPSSRRRAAAAAAVAKERAWPGGDSGSTIMTTPQPGKAKKGRGSERAEELLMWRPWRCSAALKMPTWKRWPSRGGKVKGRAVKIYGEEQGVWLRGEGGGVCVCVWVCVREGERGVAWYRHSETMTTAGAWATLFSCRRDGHHLLCKLPQLADEEVGGAAGVSVHRGA
jgi:hypothetical protein